MLKKEFEFVLQDELIYSHDGKAGLVAKKLLLRAPSCKLLGLANKLSSAVTGAFMRAYEKTQSASKNSKASKASVNSDEALTGDACYMIVSSSFENEDQAERFANAFKELVTSSYICLIDGKEPMTSDLWDQLDARELFRLMGDYISNFLLPSVMNQSKKMM